MDFAHKIEEIQQEIERDLCVCTDTHSVEVLRTKYLGKKGHVSALLAALKECTPQDKPHCGKLVNDLKEQIAYQLDHRASQLADAALWARLEKESLDVSLPGRERRRGRKHVLQAFMDRVLAILADMGFAVQYGPDIETDYYNFEALNFAPEHPARDMQDTFYIAADWLLRTHTSNTQVRIMEQAIPPIRVAIPGSCFRKEDVSARSHVQFHQVEGVYIDRAVSMRDLLATLDTFFQRLLQKEVQLRVRPSYFPFVEPGIEVDVHCIVCGGQGCTVCKHSGWLEVAGAGMIHPEVMRSGGLDPEVYSGYAWGMGIERMAMLYHRIPDIRYFLENRMAFLEQF